MFESIYTWNRTTTSGKLNKAMDGDKFEQEFANLYSAVNQVQNDRVTITGALSDLVAKFTGLMRTSIVHALNATADWITSLETALSTETSNRINADNNLQTSINNNVSNLQNQINSEASTRASADSSLQGQINQYGLSNVTTYTESVGGSIYQHLVFTFKDGHTIDLVYLITLQSTG